MTGTRVQERLRLLMAERGLRQVDILRLTRPLCAASGVRLEKNDLSQYVAGKVQPSREKLRILSRALDVSEAWLLGYDYPQQRAQAREDGADAPSYRCVPMLGDIACGVPLYADETRDDWCVVGAELDADFCLTARGDSMVGARILDGDVVFVKAMDTVENGAIAAVLIGEEATLKRVYYHPEQSTLILSPENPQYEHLVYRGEELEQVRILGRAVAFRSRIR